MKGKIFVKIKTTHIYFLLRAYFLSKHDTKDPMVELEESFLNIKKITCKKFYINPLKLIPYPRKMLSNMRISNE